MRETKEKIERFIDNVIKKNDLVLLDILWIFTYTVSVQSYSGYNRNIEKFKQLFGRTCVRNLQKKYNLKQAEIKEKMIVFVDFLNNMPSFLYGENFHMDSKLLRDVLTDKTSEVFIQNIRSEIQNLSDLDKKILSFVLHYIPIRIRDSIKKAEDLGCENKYTSLSDFNVGVDRETGSIVYFEIDTKEWTNLFNLLFNEELKELDEKLNGQRVKAILTSRGGRIGVRLYSRPGLHERFWQLGDELVKIGVGYWAFYISSGGYHDLRFVIPCLIYEAVKDYKDKLPTIKNFEEKVNEIKKEIKQKD